MAAVRAPGASRRRPPSRPSRSSRPGRRRRRAAAPGWSSSLGPRPRVVEASWRWPPARSSAGRCHDDVRPRLAVRGGLRGHRRAPRARGMAGRPGPPGASGPGQGADRPVAHGQLRPRPPRRAGAWPAASASTASSPATTATPARSRACTRSSTSARGEVLELIDERVVPLPDDPGSYFPEDARPRAPGLAPARRRPARRGRASRSTATCCAGRAGPSTSASIRSRGSFCATCRTTAGRSCAGRRSARWWSPTATRGPCTGGRTPSTSASGVSAAWPTR